MLVMKRRPYRPTWWRGRRGDGLFYLAHRPVSFSLFQQACATGKRLYEKEMRNLLVAQMGANRALDFFVTVVLLEFW